MITTYVVLVTYLLALLGIGIWASRKETIQEFFNAQRNAGTLQTTTSIIAVIGGVFLTGGAALAADVGIQALSLWIGIATGMAVLGLAAKNLQSQKLVVIATANTQPHVANIFYGCDEQGTLYFISGQDTKHSQDILESPTVAFSVTWYNKEDHTDRKGVQGTGTCTLCKIEADIRLGTKLHNQNFPEFTDRLTPEAGINKEFSVWKITPETIKYWDDETYGDGGTRNIQF